MELQYIVYHPVQNGISIVSVDGLPPTARVNEAAAEAKAITNQWLAMRAPGRMAEPGSGKEEAHGGCYRIFLFN